MIEVPLFGGFVARVDDSDFALVSSFRWRAKKGHGTLYAVAHDYENGNDRTIRMHRLILGLSGPAIDHRDGDGLNNQRHNLRVCTDSQNQYNKRRSWSRSGYKGVFWDKRKQKWWARIGVRGFLGYFDDPREAALAYDAAAIRLFGEFAATNQMLGKFQEQN